MKQIIIEGLDQAYQITKRSIPDFKGGFPNHSSQNNIYAKAENTDWTNGFYTGYLWLLYEYTRDESLKQIAVENTESFKNRIDKEIAVNHHDMGFLFSLSCVAGYKLTGEEEMKQTALKAANTLKGRFREKGKFIQAWGALDAEDNYRLIIDCLLNLPLLYWATDVTGDSTYTTIANAHLETCMKYILRPDYSTYHTYFFNLEDGSPSHGVTHQGYKDDSTWSRGQAWGVYGIALGYAYSKDENLIDKFIKVTDYFIDNLPEDYIPYWDFTFKVGNEPRDSSSAAIAVCGMIEMKKYIQDEKYREKLESYIEKIMTSLVKNYGAKVEDITNGLLYKGTYANASPYNKRKVGTGVDECVLWGDYFYVEALYRLYNPEWKMYW